VDGDLRVRHRSAGAEDLDAIVAINRASAIAAYAAIFGDAPYPEDAVRRRYTQLLGDPDVAVFIAGDVGYAAARPGHVEALYVVPGAWGSDVAGELYGQVAAVAGRPATLWVLEANERGRRFWERRGWRPTGVRDETKVTELQYAIDDDSGGSTSSNK
jgi:GNAT superfamily N-acetyltransferase